MRYLLAFYEKPDDFEARHRNDETFWRPWREYFAAIDGAGIRVGGVPLQDPAGARTTRPGAIVHDGPYADTKEQLGGFVVIDVPSLDEALAWAERAPAAHGGAVEVRPVLPMSAPRDEERPVAAPPGVAKFLLSIYETPEEFANRQGPGAERYWGAWMAYGKALEDAAVLTDGAALREPGTATVVRSNADRRTVHDGPYADTKEQLGGYLALDVPTFDDALAWAARCPAAFTGAVEVREILAIGAPA